jgi:hypothetical protein
VGEVVWLERAAWARRQRATRALHVQCRGLIADAVQGARAELTAPPARDRWVRLVRLRKLEALEEYVDALG